jgi:predicted permease
MGLRGALVISQVALSLVLLVGTGLFLRSLHNLQAVDLGFEPSSSVLVASVDLRQAGYDQPRGKAFVEQVVSRLSALPQVASATVARAVAPTPGGENWGGSQLEGSPVPQAQISFDVNAVGAGYFSTMGITLAKGRDFTTGDRAGAPMVAVVNEEMARRYWPGQEALGRRISVSDTGSGPPYAEVVGVARDGKYRGVRSTGEVMVFFPIAQHYRPQLNLIVRGRAGTPTLASVQREVRTLDAGLPLTNIRTLRTQVDLALGRDRMIATLVLLFGSLALGLAAVGLFGVMAFDTSRRTREIGVRMALGARPVDVLGQVVSRGFRLVSIGMVAGAAAAFALSRFATSLLYQVTPADPVAFVAAAVALALVAGVASWLPARRAANVDPMVALRRD